MGDTRAVRRQHGAEAPVGWTYRDDVLVATLVAVREAMEGRLVDRPILTSRFALQFPGERLVASGRYRLDWSGAIGDGSYSSRSFFVGGTGAVGIGLAAGSLIASNHAATQARNRTMMDARRTWRFVDAGDLHVSDDGFYLNGGCVQ